MALTQQQLLLLLLNCDSVVKIVESLIGKLATIAKYGDALPSAAQSRLN